MASLLVIIIFAPAPESSWGQAAIVRVMAPIANWVFMPSLLLTLVAGLLAIAVTHGYQDAGWVWVKAATGILIFEGGLSVQGPIQDIVNKGRGVANHIDPAILARTLVSERNTLWVLVAVSLANVALGVWRPRFPQYPL